MENLFKQLIEKLKTHSLNDYPREACGVILKDFTYVPARNLSNAPTLSFELDPGVLVEHDENIWGVFHSHPGEEQPLPSKDDKHSAVFSEYKFIVGFGEKYYIYWYNQNLDATMFEEFKVKHLGNN